MDSNHYIKILKELNWKKCESDSAVIFKTYYLLEHAMYELAKYDSKKNKYLVKLDTDLTDKVIELNDAPIKVTEIERAINILVSRKVMEKISGGWLYSSFVDANLKKEQATA